MRVRCTVDIICKSLELQFKGESLSCHQNLKFNTCEYVHMRVHQPHMLKKNPLCISFLDYFILGFCMHAHMQMVKSLIKSKSGLHSFFFSSLYVAFFLLSCLLFFFLFQFFSFLLSRNRLLLIIWLLFLFPVFSDTVSFCFVFFFRLRYFFIFLKSVISFCQAFPLLFFFSLFRVILITFFFFPICYVPWNHSIALFFVFFSLLLFHLSICQLPFFLSAFIPSCDFLFTNHFKLSLSLLYLAIFSTTAFSFFSDISSMMSFI